MHIANQSYLFKERVLSNGEDYNIHYVVRKTPFEITLRNDACFFATSQKLECHLVYHKTRKLVESNYTGPPLEYQCSSNHIPNSCTVSIRVNVLSTQHANCLFSIHFVFGSQSVYSEPIRSVSKPEQIRKKLAQCDPAELGSEYCKSKKRARSEELLDALAMIQHSQEHQTALITSLVSQQRHQPLLNSRNIEESLKQFLSSYEHESTEQRPIKIGKIVNSLGEEKKKLLAELSHVILRLTEAPECEVPDQCSFPSMEDLNLTEEFSSDLSDDSMACNVDGYLGWFVS
jgi:hypothetical protein